MCEWATWGGASQGDPEHAILSDGHDGHGPSRSRALKPGFELSQSVADRTKLGHKLGLRSVDVDLELALGLPDLLLYLLPEDLPEPDFSARAEAADRSGDQVSEDTVLDIASAVVER